MTPDERERYGQLLQGLEETETETREDLSDFMRYRRTWDDLSPRLQKSYENVAERFIAAAGLVPLAEVRAIVKEHEGYNTTAVGACGAIRAALAERFGKEE